MRKRWALLLIAAAMVFSFSGCLSGTAEELYCLPALSDEYMSLQKQVDTMLQAGTSYSAPVSGNNRQSIQLQDVDGDGTNEALVFVENPETEKRLRVCIFDDYQDTYSLSCTIEGDGARFESVSYSDMDGDGISELIVGWQMSAELKLLTAYSIKDYQPTNLLSTDYSEYTMTDLTRDGNEDLVVVRMAATERSGEVEMYSLMQDGELVSAGTKLSAGVESLSRLRVSGLQDGTPAVYFESVINSTNLVTDIVVYRNDKLRNITVNANTGVSESTVRGSMTFSRDMNGDEVLEIPRPVQLPTQSESTSYWEMQWYDYSIGGRGIPVLSTFHNTTDGWYFVLPEEWEGKIAVRREEGANRERSIVFSRYDERKDSIGEDILSISALSGNQAEAMSRENGRFFLMKEDDIVFAARILSGSSQFSLTETLVRTNFHIIYSEWISGDAK